ncbi:MAG: hypothetical protein H8E84_00920 [Flavobacteriales bacterium]|nr:hypothetical protein [Flavobacteriales bacterium]
MARKPPKGKSLAEVNLELAKQWHPTKNGGLTPFDVFAKSGIKVWWKCDKGDDHEWETRIINRKTINNTKCPICSGHKTVLSNSILTTHPEIAKQWHPTKNKGLFPESFSKGSHQNIWWKCNKGEDHEWQISIKHRTTGNGCRICSGYKVVRSNSLELTHPELTKEWHPTKNGILTPRDIHIGSSTNIWWKCDKGDDHIWKAPPLHRGRRGDGCPVCSGFKVVKSNCLATTHPEIAKQWHATKNTNLTPDNVTSGSNRRVWWVCLKNKRHIFKSTIYGRKLYGCPICANQIVTDENCLSKTHPKIAQQWHPTKNGNLTPEDVVAGSFKKIWWKCNKGEDHVWKTIVVSRKYGRACPYCTLTPQSKQELTITFELLQFFKNINPKGFKTRVEGKLWSIDIYIPELNLGIEFDGSYWHKDKRQLDKLKTKQLQKEGFEIIRVRQKPLKRIFKTDVMAAKKFDGKKVTNDVLLQIMKMYKLDARKVKRIEKYLEKDSLQNQKGLDKYIDQILTEKAEKKKE